MSRIRVPPPALSKKHSIGRIQEFDPRKLMELAIEVMHESVHEPRKDGKASPRVGAVLLKSDGTVEKACRGELRYGDHAEYTLLERKNRHNKLDGAKLFATLEPCAPGARKDPKLSCAERIVLARIKEVWVGIEDPDPMVDRKGIKYLQDSGVIVHMFDRDLQESIQAANKDFIAQALERAAEQEEIPKRIILSSMESARDVADFDNLSREALARYRRRMRITKDIDSPEFMTILLQQGVLAREGDHYKPTGFGIILFGKEPRDIIRQAGLLAKISYPDGSIETRDFVGSMILMPDAIEEWLKSKLPNIVDRNQMQRKERPTLPFEMIREAVVNALVHRDYDIVEAKCQLEVTPDTITIKSPGKPLSPITLEQLQSFKAPMLSRNPELHYVFARMDLAEERGLGMLTLRSLAERNGLPLPKYSFDDPYLVLTLFRNAGSAIASLSPEIREVLNRDERAGWEFVSTKTSIRKSDYAEAMGFNDRKAQRHLKRFVELGLLKQIGSAVATEYVIVHP